MKTIAQLLTMSQEEKNQEQIQDHLDDAKSTIEETVRLSKRALRKLKREKEAASVNCNSEKGLLAYLNICQNIRHLEEDLADVGKIEVGTIPPLEV